MKPVETLEVTHVSVCECESCADLQDAARLTQETVKYRDSKIIIISLVKYHASLVVWECFIYYSVGEKIAMIVAVQCA